MRKMTTIELKNITKQFVTPDKAGTFKAVDDVSLRIEAGKFVTLLGPSGCGKTTILRMIAGFETPTAGDILVDGKRINDLPPDKRDSAMVFQSYALFPHLSVFNNVAFGLELKQMPAAIIAKHHIDRLYWPSNQRMMPIAAKETLESPPSRPSMPSTMLKALIAAHTANNVRK